MQMRYQLRHSPITQPPFPVIRRHFFLAPPWQLLYSNGSPPRVQIDPRAVPGAGPAASSSAWWAGDDAG
jgi:hypothetical protein